MVFTAAGRLQRAVSPRESTEAKLRIESQVVGMGPTGEQMVTVGGTAAQIEAVLRNLVDAVQTEAQQPCFQDWGSSSNASGPGGSMFPGAHSGYPQAIMGPQGGPAMSVVSPAQLGRMGNPEVDLLANVVQSLPPQAMTDPRGFALSCVC